MKYEIRERSIEFSKSFSEKILKKYALLLSEITKLEQDIDSEEKFDEYNKAKSDL